MSECCSVVYCSEGKGGRDGLTRLCYVGVWLVDCESVPPLYLLE